MSTIGLAASPGTAVLPKCSIRRISCRNTRAKMLRLASEQVGPARVIGQDADIFVDGSLDALLRCVHFTRDALSRLASSNVSAVPGCTSASILPERERAGRIRGAITLVGHRLRRGAGRGVRSGGDYR